MKRVYFATIMKYPPYPISHTARRIIMALLIVSFCVLSPIIVLYTAGYRYDFSTNRILSRGSISVDIDTKDITVFINNKQITQKPPIRLSNLAPNSTYTISIQKDGYHTWQHDVLVKSNQTTYIKDIFLIKKSTPTNITKNTRHISTLSFSPSGEYVLKKIKRKKDNTIIFLLYSITKKEDVRLLIPTTPQTIVSWSPDNDHLLIYEKNKASHITMIAAHDPHTRHLSPTPLNLQEFQWGGVQKNPTLFMRSENDLYYFSENIFTRIALQVEPVWHVDKNQVIWEYNKENSYITKRKNTTKENVFYSQDPITTIVSINKDRIIAKKRQSISIITRPKQNQAAQENTIAAHHTYYNNKKKEWILWSPWELWSVYPNGNTSLLNRTSEPISLVREFDSYGVLLLGSKNTVSVFNPGYYITNNIINIDTIEDMRINRTMEKIYIIGTHNNTYGVFEFSY
ncbi:MAG: hypothetical protein CL685_03090 [Candidatus Magasanikbacteria bacterium]|nr:hypothetical protein [Candidatus Magasanikbacteria bacterium]|tara:strand:+ start:104 stop:1471 length:1368 start_codon:yes stop_codon:yes gene_type:complete